MKLKKLFIGRKQSLTNCRKTISYYSGKGTAGSYYKLQGDTDKYYVTASGVWCP